jgi:O-antigen ligase
MMTSFRSRVPRFRLLWVLFVFSLPFADLLFFPQILVGAGQLSTLTATVLFLALVLADPGRAAKTLLANPVSRAFLMFLAVALLSVSMSVFAPLSEWKDELLWFKSLKQVLQLILCYMCFGVILLYLPRFRSLAQGARIYTMTAWLCVAYGAIESFQYLGLEPPGFVQISHVVHLGTFFADPDKPNMAYLPDAAGLFRLRLLASEPSMAGNFLITIVPFALYFAKGRSRIRWKILAACTLLLVFFTFSTAAVVSLACGFLISKILFAQTVGAQMRLVGVVLTLTLLLAVFAFAPGLLPQPMRIPMQVAERLINSDTDISVSGRLLEVRTAWTLFTDYPLLGVGIGNWVFHYPERIMQVPSSYIYLDEQISVNGFQRPMGVNNLYLRVLCETGLVGLIAWLYFLLAAVRAVHRFAGRFPQHLSLARAITTSIVMLAVNLNAMSSFDKRYWWVVFGFAGVAGELAKGRAGSTDSMPN